MSSGATEGGSRRFGGSRPGEPTGSPASRPGVVVQASRPMPESTAMKAAELARRLGGVLHGDGERVVRGVAPLEEAGRDSLSWAAGEKYLRAAARSSAGVILIGSGSPPIESAVCIAVADVEAALCRVLEWFGPPVPVVPTGVDATAVVSASAWVEGAAVGAHVFVGPGARVGAGTQLHPGVYVGAESRIGRECVLWPNVVVRERVTIGDRVVIHPNATIGADGFGYLFRDGGHRKVPQIGTVVIEDDVEIGANSAVDRAKCGVTRIGRGSKIDNLVQVGHNVTIGADCVLVAQSGVSGSSRLGRGVVLAGQVGLADHIRLGDGVTVTAKSGVAGDIPAGQVYSGIPAIPNRRFLREQAALRRLAELREQVRELHRRIEQLESSTDHPERG